MNIIYINIITLYTHITRAEGRAEGRKGGRKEGRAGIRSERRAGGRADERKSMR